MRLGVVHYRYPEADAGDLVLLGPQQDGGYVHDRPYETGSPDKARCVVASKIRLKREAAQALSSAAQYLYELNGDVLKLDSGFRSTEQQRRVFIKILRQRRNLARSLRRVAPPGCSEHHTGLVVDLAKTSDTAGRILPLFGWELSYPQGNSQNIKHEPWHFRFIGYPVIRRELERLRSDQPKAPRELIAVCERNVVQFRSIDFRHIFSNSGSLRLSFHVSAAAKTDSDRRERVTHLISIFEELNGLLEAERKAFFRSDTAILREINALCAEQGFPPVEDRDQGAFMLELIVPLSLGDKNERVYRLQAGLQRHGCFNRPETGYFGPITEAAVKDYQKHNGLRITGVADFDMLRCLRSSSRTFADSITKDNLPQITRGEWLQVPKQEPWIVNRLINGYYPLRVKKHDLIIGSSAKSGWNSLKYIDKFLEVGCSGMILDIEPAAVPPALPVLRVGSTRNALARLAIQARKQIQGQVILITGSSGKTTTQEMLKLVLSNQFNTVSSPGSANSTQAICYRLINAALKSRFLVFESGLGAEGSSIKDHSRILAPNVALITSVDLAHAEGYQDVREIAKRKADVFSGLQKNGYAVLDRDSNHYEALRQHARDHGTRNIFTFGWHKDSDAQIQKIRINESGTRIAASLVGTYTDFFVPLAGQHWGKLALAVLAICHLVGADVAQAIRDLGKFLPVPGRGSVLSINAASGTIKIFDSHYNANPGSMRTDMETYTELADMTEFRKIAIIGDMKELGAGVESAHRELASMVELSQFSRIFLIGEEIRRLQDELDDKSLVHHFASVDDGLQTIIREIQGGDFIFLKGSNANKLSLIVRHLNALSTAEGAPS